MTSAFHAFDTNQASALAGLFSAGVVRELATKGRSMAFARLAKQSGVLPMLDSRSRIGDLFDTAFVQLKKRQNRNEYVYKAAIVHKILLGTHSLNTATLLSEFRVGASKADVAILNGTATVYEIKSERDNLDRLVSQLASYRRFFPRVNIICGTNHIDDVVSVIPPEVGILVLSDRFRITTIRPAIDFYGEINSSSILETIQVSEAKKLLRLMGVSVPNVPNTQMYKEIAGILSDMDVRRVHSEAVSVLRQARSQRPLSCVLEGLPSSLQAAVISSSLGRNDCDRLLEIMSLKVGDALKWA